MTAPPTAPANRAGPALLICMAPTAIPGQLVLKLPAKLEPSLAEEGAVQSGLGRDLLTCCPDLPAVDKPNPSSFGQENPSPIQLETLRVSQEIEGLAVFLDPGKPLRNLFIERLLKRHSFCKARALFQTNRQHPACCRNNCCRSCSTFSLYLYALRIFIN